MITWKNCSLMLENVEIEKEKWKEEGNMEEGWKKKKCWRVKKESTDSGNTLVGANQINR